MRFPLALATLGCVLVTGCTDLDPATDTHTEELFFFGCTGGIKFDGHWPTIGQWTGTAPQAVSANQYFVVTPIDSQGSQYLAVQADWERGKITWAVKITRSQRAQVVATLSLQPGSIDALGGVRPPTNFPPGTDEGQWVIDSGYRDSILP